MNPFLKDESRSGESTGPRNSRREAREAILQILYAYEYTQDNPGRIIEDVCENFSESAMDFIRRSSKQIIDCGKDLDAYIQSHTENWDFERIALIDRLLMRIGINEILHFEDIPPKVSINEVIEISKRYSTDKSSKFINGILDAVYEDLKRGGQINKTGRGVINS